MKHLHKYTVESKDMEMGLMSLYQRNSQKLEGTGIKTTENEIQRQNENKTGTASGSCAAGLAEAEEELGKEQKGHLKKSKLSLFHIS